MSARRNQGYPRRRSIAGRVVSWLARIILVLLLFVGLLLVTVFSFEQYSLQPLAEFLVKKTTGRVLTIDGEIDARAGRIVSLRVDGIRLANADWGSDDSMLSIDEAEISADLFAVLGGRLAIDTLVVNNARMLVEEDEQGLSNWAMGSDEGDADNEGDEQPATASRGLGPPVLPVIRSQLSNIEIMVKSAALPRPIDIRLDSVGHRADMGNEIHATIIGSVEKRTLKLQASIGPIQQLLKAGAVDFDFTGDFEEVSIDAEGHLDKLLEPGQVNLQASLAAPEISRVLENLGFPKVISGKTELEVSLLPSGDHHRLDLSASVDSLKLDAEARLQSLNSIDGGSLALAVQGPDLAALAKLAGIEGLPSQPFDFNSSMALSGSQLTIGETNFDSGDTHLNAMGTLSQFPRLEGTNLQLQLVGKNYLEYAGLLGLTETTGLQPEPFELRTDLVYNTQDEQQFTARVKLADIGGEFSGLLTGHPAFIGSQLEYLFEGQSDGLLQRLLGRATAIEGTYVLRGNLKRTGAGYGIDQTVLSIGDNELRVDGTIGEHPLRGDTELSVQFLGPDLGKIAAAAGYSGFVPAGDADINANLRTQDNAVQVDNFKAELGRNRLQASGLVGLQDGMAGSRLKVELSGQDIAEALPPEILSYVDAQQSFELTAALETDVGQLAISALQARLGNVTLQTSGNISITRPLTDMSLKIDASGPDLAAIVPENLLPYDLPAAKFSISGGVALTQEGLELDAVDAQIGPDSLGLSGTIPLDTPTDGLQLVIAASGPDLGAIVPLEVDQFDLNGLAYELGGQIQLARGVLSLSKLDFSMPSGRLVGSLSVSLDNPLQFGQFDLEASGRNLAEFIPATPAYTPAAVAFDLDALGSWDSERISVEQGSLNLDSASIEVQGEVDLRPGMTATRLVLSARGDSLDDIGQFEQLTLPPEEFHIDASLQGNAKGLQIPQLEAHLGESDLSGSLHIEFADKPRLKIRLNSSLLDLTKLLQLEDDSTEIEAPLQTGTGDARIIPQTPVPAELLSSVNLETEIRFAELRLLHYTLREVEYDSKLQDGRLVVSRLNATASQGQLSARFEAAAQGDRIATRGRLEGKDFSLGIGEASEGLTELPRQDLILKFDTEGATLRELAANLDGYLQLTGDAGRLRNSRALGLFGSFYSELFNALNPLATREPYTNISCFAAYGEIEDGIARINPGAVIQTDKLDIFAIGQVDLNTEKVSLRFDSTARKGIGVSVADFVNPFVGVSGTLSEPKLGIDPENAMFQGGFAYATGGLSIVLKSLYARWFGTKDPCASFEKEAEEILRAKQAAKEKREAEQQKETGQSQ